QGDRRPRTGRRGIPLSAGARRAALRRRRVQERERVRARPRPDPRRAEEDPRRGRVSPLRKLFLLDPDVVYLNHGSFGACPRPVFDRYQAWQHELEREPVRFITRRLTSLLAAARAELGAFVGAPADDLTFVQNATTGVNIAARALELRPGDEGLATDLEYDACDSTWENVCERAGARYVRAEVDRLFEGRSEHTRAVFISHVTSETALLLPLE